MICRFENENFLDIPILYVSRKEEKKMKLLLLGLLFLYFFPSWCCSLNLSARLNKIVADAMKCFSLNYVSFYR